MGTTIMRNRTLRRLGTAVALLVLPAVLQAADFEPELGSVETMDEPGPHWFVTMGFFGGGHIFDGDSGEMRGKVNVSDYTTALYLDRERSTIYVPGTFYSRGTYGERTDVVVFNDAETLAPVAEVEVPKKLAVVFHRAVINPIGDRFIGLYNMTPAMSVSIVDVERRRFVGEISTAGCGFVYPLSGRRFMQLCGDGTVQVIGLDRNGAEASRERSEAFFDIDGDPVFDLALAKPDGWLLVSFEGQVFEVTVGDEIEISEPWSLLTEGDAAEGWRVGGDQPFAYNAETGMLFTLMHQGGPDTHEDPGTEVWAFNVSTQRRGYRLPLEEPSGTIEASTDADPLLYVMGGFPAGVHVYRAVTGRWLHTIPETGMSASHIQAF
ncbi:MAG: amine dehydrogenase large subunit [Pseudomonadota bacterium]